MFVLANYAATSIVEDGDETIITLYSKRGKDKIDKSGVFGKPQKSSAYIPFQTSYDTHYIYVSSRTSIFGTYKIKDNGEEALAEGVFTVTPGNRQTINITTLPEGEYTLEMTIGEETLEGNFCIE